MRAPAGQCTQDLAVPSMQDPVARYMQAQVVPAMRALAALAMLRMRQANSAPQFANPWHRQCQ